jgi:hypothetical protein
MRFCRSADARALLHAQQATNIYRLTSTLTQGRRVRASVEAVTEAGAVRRRDRSLRSIGTLRRRTENACSHALVVISTRKNTALLLHQQK